MHELAMAEGILDVVLDAAQDRRVQRVRLKIGRLHAVVDESMRYSFQLVADGSCAAQATLDIETVPAAFQCQACGAHGLIQLGCWTCSACGASEIRLTAGQELSVVDIELEGGIILSQPTAEQTSIIDHLHHHYLTEHGDERSGA